MRSRISIRGCVRPSVRPSVRRSVRRSVGPSVGWSVRHTRVEFPRNGPNSNKIASGKRKYVIWKTNQRQVRGQLARTHLLSELCSTCFSSFAFWLSFPLNSSFILFWLFFFFILSFYLFLYSVFLSFFFLAVYSFYFYRFFFSSVSSFLVLHIIIFPFYHSAFFKSFYASVVHAFPSSSSPSVASFMAWQLFPQVDFFRLEMLSMRIL